MEAWHRLRFGVAALVAVLVVGTAGYVALGFSVLDAIYQTVTTVSTVGFREVQPLSSGGRVFTIVLILVGVATALYTFTLILEAVVEGQIQEVLGRKRMERQISRMADHVIVCGFGRVGRNLARYVSGAGQEVVVIESDPDRAAQAEGSAHVVRGDATSDEVLKEAGIERARVLVTALNTDADNLFVTLTARSLCSELFIVARARVESSEAKLAQAGADRVVNPQRLGGSRMAAFVLQPHVVEFLDVVMHDGSLEFRLEEVPLPDGSPLAGRSLREAHIRDSTGALVLALRDSGGEFTTNPPPETVLIAGQILIAIGTEGQLEALAAAARA
ncbi:MAG: voltage-gated potassium channel [Actinomycetota bacterium]|nr:voltage-gated potassium channel [Actinomycetota bacterium]MDQ1502367.1 voltage-gated potassium channel [Actinomycetota bacterium]